MARGRSPSVRHSLKGQQMVLVTYLISTILLLAAAYIVFSVLSRRDYRRQGRLSPISCILGSAIFFLWGAFPYIYGPSDWPAVHVGPILELFGWLSIACGLTVMFTAMATLGLRCSLGQRAPALKRSGYYRLSRNPQLLGCALAGIGFAILWPSWYALGWLLLFIAIAHMMVRTEEAHLRTTYGQAYDRYCQQVPRYLGLLRR